MYFQIPAFALFPVRKNTFGSNLFGWCFRIKINDPYRVGNLRHFSYAPWALSFTNKICILGGPLQMLNFIHEFLLKSYLPPSSDVLIELKRVVLVIIEGQQQFRMVHLETKANFIWLYHHPIKLLSRGLAILLLIVGKLLG